ncbi:hypothetical protein Patl1_15857 [Pistacia atlantica]|uniref:Uncharacterized protein n=1 Tax=Pistacia atlantica TaxID=434234 RepID=A0ACC1BB90_9ROSI|nr:hypothetical protein Patl1_15857 [Pistacia atlantica]
MLEERLEKMSNQLNNRSLMFDAGSNHQPLKDNAILAKSVAVIPRPTLWQRGLLWNMKVPTYGWMWCLMGVPSLPFSNDEEFLVKGSDAIGHRLLWQEELVSKKVQKKYATPEKVAKKLESMYNKVDSDMEIKDIELLGNELAITPIKSEPKQMKLDKKHTSLEKRERSM